MNKLIILSFCAALIACGGESGSDQSKDTVEASDNAATARQPEVDTNVNNIGTNRSADASAAGSHKKGEELIASSDCLTCHKVDQKIVGPAYKDVANKYPATEANINYLANKIIKGGAGAWGEIPMTPHPQLSTEDAKEMAAYVLSLK